MGLSSPASALTALMKASDINFRVTMQAQYGGAVAIGVVTNVGRDGTAVDGFGEVAEWLIAILNYSKRALAYASWDPVVLRRETGYAWKRNPREPTWLVHSPREAAL